MLAGSGTSMMASSSMYLQAIPRPEWRGELTESRLYRNFSPLTTSFGVEPHGTSWANRSMGVPGGCSQKAFFNRRGRITTPSLPIPQAKNEARIFPRLLLICFSLRQLAASSPLHICQHRELIQQHVVDVLANPQDVALAHGVQVIALSALLVTQEVVHRQPYLPRRQAPARVPIPPVG